MNQLLTECGKEDILAQPDPQYPTELRNLIYLGLSLNYGLRSDELVDLRWPRIDFQNGNILIKNRKENRLVPLSEHVITLLDEWKGRQFNQWQKRNNDRAFSERVFTELDGAPIDEKYISNMVKMHVESAGIKKKVDYNLLHKSFKKGLA